mgnify:CR=1 FL=1
MLSFTNQFLEVRKILLNRKLVSPNDLCLMSDSTVKTEIQKHYVILEAPGSDGEKYFLIDKVEYKKLIDTKKIETVSR